MGWNIVEKANIKDVAGYHVYKSVDADDHASTSLSGAAFSVPVNQSSVNLAIVVSGTAGTSPLTDVKLEGSWDGTNWVTLNAAIGSQIAGNGSTYENHVFNTSGSAPYYRFTYTLDRTTGDETYDLTSYYWYKAQGNK